MSPFAEAIAEAEALNGTLTFKLAVAVAITDAVVTVKADADFKSEVAEESPDAEAIKADDAFRLAVPAPIPDAEAVSVDVDAMLAVQDATAKAELISGVV